MTPTFETLGYGVEDGVATITLNRPEKMNAFNGVMASELQAVFDATDADDAVGAVIVTGSGRAFCAGADLSPDSAAPGEGAFGGGRGGDAQTIAPRDRAGLVTLRIFDSRKPVIAAVNGAAVGVGSTMLLPMDVRLASTQARFGFVFSRRGITLEGASSWFLPRLVGPQTALDWLYAGRVFEAQEALERGLVRSLHAPDDLLPAARALARTYVDNVAPVSVALTRQLVWRTLGAEHPMTAHRYESRALHHRARQGDVREGVGAFLEKRPAVFADRVSTDLPDVWADWTAPTYD